MSMPNFQQLMLPMLHRLCERHDDTHISRLEDDVAKLLKLTSDDLARILPSGQQSVFSNRLNWARSYLSKAGLIEAPRRGYYRATDRARVLMLENLREIDLGVLSRFPEFVAWRTQQKSDNHGPELSESEGKESPEEFIAAKFEILNAELAREIIDRVHAFTPAFFERLIIELLVRMGYGGGRAEMCKALGRVGDGGIDGVIKEDELGLDVVCVQAKRFAPDTPVPLREVRDFVGGLEGHRATKGVFVTTSYFPSAAHDYITRVSKRVTLIDGCELANLMIRHCVGVRVKHTYEIRKIDEDYFVE